MSVNPRNLPIYELETDLLASLRRGNRVIVEAPTGSGKSTQIPQMLLDGGVCRNGQVVVLQPRRLAARMLARRVARERGVSLGDEVGYQVRFDNRCSARTRIRYETDGIILRRLASDPSLREVAAIVFDEFHERHMYGDVMLGLARRLQQMNRPDLRIVVMSATLESEALARFLEPVPVLRSGGRTYPVDIRYLDRAPKRGRDDPWELATGAFAAGAARETEGDVLVFMPGAYEIRRTIEALRRTPAAKDCQVLPLHGELKPEEQDAAVSPSARRKIVVSTNVAETSLTIDGVRVVIDCGLARKARFDAHRGIDTLMIEKISRASADQRAGRAGRTAPGVCLRLWTEADHAGRPANEAPEICRVDLAEVVLVLKAMGVADVEAFPWLDPPPPAALARASGLLEDLGALDARTHAITEIGRRMPAYPVHPRYARLLHEGDRRGCVPDVALVAALTQDRDMLLPRQNRDVVERRLALLDGPVASDLQVLLACWRYAEAHAFSVEACARLGIHAGAARQAGRLYSRFLAIAESQGLDISGHAPDPDALRKCLLIGFSDRLARRVGNGRCELVHGRRGTLDRGTAVESSRLLVASEINEIQSSRGDVDVRLSLVTAIEPEWLEAMYADEFAWERRVAYDPLSKRVTAERRRVFRGLVVDVSHGDTPTREEAAAALAAEVLKGNLAMKDWDHTVEQWIMRVNLVAEHCPELGLAPITDESREMLIEQACLGAMGYRDIKDKPVKGTVRAWLSPAEQPLIDRYAPTRVTLSNGRTPRVTYDAVNPPSIALRIQELYDVTGPITVAMGRVRVVVQILAPNNRPVQITDDLASFWQTGYERAKKELRGRYPKHEWR